MSGAYSLCPGCGRRILEDLLARASSHAPGCPTRRSLLAKAAAAKPKNVRRRIARQRRIRGAKT